MNARSWLVVALVVCVTPLSHATADDKKLDPKPKEIDKATAEAACKALKRSDFECMPLRD